MIIAYLCLHVFHSWLSRVWPVPLPRVTIPRMIIPRVTILHMALDELHEMYIFYTTRKRGPDSHITGLFKYLSCCRV